MGCDLSCIHMLHHGTGRADDCAGGGTGGNSSGREHSFIWCCVNGMGRRICHGAVNFFPVQISYWYFVFLLMGMAIILYIVRLVYRCTEANDHIMGIAAVLALGHLTYFINRPCFDYLAIGFFEAVLIMAVIADRCWKRESGLAYGKRGVQLMSVSILSVYVS